MVLGVGDIGLIETYNINPRELPDGWEGVPFSYGIVVHIRATSYNIWFGVDSSSTPKLSYTITTYENKPSVWYKLTGI